MEDLEELVAGTIGTIIFGAEREVLVEVVKFIQKRGLIGSRGNWKEFLNFFDKMFGAALSDPSKRAADVLVAFIKSFNHTKDLTFIGKIFRHIRDQRAFEKYIKSLNEESPEQRLVRLTVEHPQYKRHYSFDSYDKNWIVVPLDDMSKSLQTSSMLAVDCEMVLCNDGTEELVKVCVVDHKLKVKLEKLVNPNKAISSYRTAITGVAPEDLVGVTCSVVDIQASMKKLLKRGTILVGHGLHNDLRALKIAYLRVIDTAYIFKCSGVPPTHTPSLNSLCKTFLGSEVRKEGAPHDCRNDAEAAMKLVLEKLKHGFDDPIKIAKRAPDYSEAMLLHKVLVGVPCQELKKVFPRDFDIDIKADLKVRGHFYSTRAIFKDALEANVAFQRVEGEEKKDSQGRPQKRVHLKLSTGQTISFYVCKITSFSPAEDSKRRRTSPSASTESNDEGRSCSSESRQHANEILRLKQALSAREDELFNLQKIVADLTGQH